MPVTDYSTTAGSNTSINGINIGEGCAPANLNDMGRNIMADIAGWRTGSVSTLFTGGGTFGGAYTFSNAVTFSGAVALSGGLASALSVADGGTGAGTFIAGRLLVGQGTSAITSGIIADNGSQATVNGVLAVTGDLVLAGNTLLGAALTTGGGVSTGNAALEVGGLRSGDGASFIDLHGVAGSDFSARIARLGGTNGILSVANTGTGDMIFATNGTTRMTITGAGAVVIAGGGTIGSNAYRNVTISTSAAPGSLASGDIWLQVAP